VPEKAESGGDRPLSLGVFLPEEETERLGLLPLTPLDEGEDVAASKILQCTDPARGQVFAQIRAAGLGDVERAVEAATLTWALWRGTAFKDRRARLQRLSVLIREQAETIAELIALEQGKPVVEALTLEVLPALDHLNFLSVHAEEAYFGEAIVPRHELYSHKWSHYLYEPMGLVAIATPYNLPFALPLIQVAAAVTMGNAVLLKPSELAPLCGLKIGELCRAAGFPEGLIQVLPMKQEDALYVVSHPRVDKVFLTGSPSTGQQVMATAGCMPKPVVLSLGGKHPAVVASDADLERTARGIVWGALANAGQHCAAIERVYVVEPVATALVSAIVDEIDKLNTGDPRDRTSDLGPLISSWRRRHVHAQVTEAVEGGGRLLRGGSMPVGGGFFYPPTVVLSPPEDCRLLREETLGPVIPIVVVDNLERGVMMANDSTYSLSASGWTSSKANAERLMSGLQASVVTINDVLYTFGEPAATKSGYRMSGLGHFHGIAGLREMTRRRFVSSDPSGAEAPLFAFPYDGVQQRLVRAALDLLHGGGIARRMRGMLRLLGSRRFRARVPQRFFLLRSRHRRK
jgi:succinate-semialdehyde dehydrogenase/glutarate-semialdehyde dehydrogenase